MEEQSPYIPKSPTPPPAPEKNLEWPAAVPTPVQPKTPLWAIAATVIVLGTFATILVVMSQRKPSSTATEIASAAPTPTPTPVRTPSVVATQSAFLNLETSVTSLSNLLDASGQDPTLTPPVVDLQLELLKQ